MTLSLGDSTSADFWTALPSILWIAFTATVLICIREPLWELLSNLVARVKEGASFKIGSFELGAFRAEQQQHTPAPLLSAEGSHELESQIAPGSNPVSAEAFELSDARQKFYANTRKIMIVHRLFRSSRPNQVYDVLIYLVPHGNASLAEVTNVEYFFGRYWNNQLFPSLDRSLGYPIVTSAYGPFLCCARVTFNSGPQAILFRYIDFEMGATAPRLEKKSEEKPKDA